jgi:PelA/Pel-15E family pectate lyase
MTMTRHWAGLFAVALCLSSLMSAALAADEPTLASQATAAIAKTVQYLRTEVAVGGGYLGSYTADLSDQWGEDHATRDQNWIQPPGCPSVGFSFLRAWEATGDAQYLDAAKEVAMSLVSGQLECGGWDYIVDHSADGAKRWFYRRNKDNADEALRKGRNQATMDDNTTQHATRLLMAVDKALDFKDAAIHDAALYALDFLLRAQDASGGWPQRFPLRGTGYSDYFTFNDNTFADCVDVMMIAYQTYGDQKYRDAIIRAGEFILKTQLPQPHPVWAQQYDRELKPAWARKFEPPAATAGESMGVLRTLIKIALFTGDTKWLAPFPTALEWYHKSELTGADKGLWARFYEIGTNTPIYMTKDYKLTYDGSDTPTHYSFKGRYFTPSVETQYNEIMQKGIAKYQEDHAPKPLTEEGRQKQAQGMEEKVRAILAAQDDKGRWVRDGKILMEDFERNLDALSAYLKLVNGR